MCTSHITVCLRLSTAAPCPKKTTQVGQLRRQQTATQKTSHVSQELRNFAIPSCLTFPDQKTWTAAVSWKTLSDSLYPASWDFGTSRMEEKPMSSLGTTPLRNVSRRLHLHRCPQTLRGPHVPSLLPAASAAATVKPSHQARTARTAPHRREGTTAT